MQQNSRYKNLNKRYKAKVSRKKSATQLKTSSQHKLSSSRCPNKHTIWIAQYANGVRVFSSSFKIPKYNPFLGKLLDTTRVLLPGYLVEDWHITIPAMVPLKVAGGDIE